MKGILKKIFYGIGFLIWASYSSDWPWLSSAYSALRIVKTKLAQIYVEPAPTCRKCCVKIHPWLNCGIYGGGLRIAERVRKFRRDDVYCNCGL